MAAAFRAEAWAQHAMVLTYLLDLKAAVLTASCTRFRREADPPDLAHLVTVEKVWTRRAQWTEASSAGVSWKKKTLLLSPWLGRALLPALFVTLTDRPTAVWVGGCGRRDGDHGGRRIGTGRSGGRKFVVCRGCDVIGWRSRQHRNVGAVTVPSPRARGLRETMDSAGSGVRAGLADRSPNGSLQGP